MREKIAERGIDIADFFKKFDKNGDGVFNHIEFEMAFVAMDIEITRTELRRFVALADANKDGRVDFNEFYSILNRPDDDFAESEMDKALEVAESEIDFEASIERFE